MQEVILKLDTNMYNIVNKLTLAKGIDLSKYSYVSNYCNNTNNLPIKKTSKTSQKIKNCGSYIKGKWYKDDTEYLMSNEKNIREINEAIKRAKQEKNLVEAKFVNGKLTFSK